MKGKDSKKQKNYFSSKQEKQEKQENTTTTNVPLYNQNLKQEYNYHLIT